MNKSDMSSKIRKANRKIYNSLSPAEYNRNESIFNERRRFACEKIISDAALHSGNERCLDLGTGTGNLLQSSQKYFNSSFGADLGENLLLKIKNEFPQCNLTAADAENLPFKDESFNFVSCYALLHHLYRHEGLAGECRRVLKSGGTLYTDHDPNYFFNRFYHLLYRLVFAGRHGFGSETADLAEYHNVFSSGVNPEILRKTLLNAGFREVSITYRITDGSNFGFIRRTALQILRTMAKIIPSKSFYTHFSIIAVK